LDCLSAPPLANLRGFFSSHAFSSVLAERPKGNRGSLPVGGMTAVSGLLSGASRRPPSGRRNCRTCRLARI